MFSSSMALELPWTAMSPSDVSRFSDTVLSGIGQERPRFRSYRVDLFSCLLFGRTERDEFSLAIRRRECPPYCRGSIICVVICYLVLASCISIVQVYPCELSLTLCFL